MSRRVLNLTGFVCCAALLGYALYVQSVLGVDPCPLCIFQRIGIAALGSVFLVAGLHAPRGRGAWVYGALLALAALTTMAVAARHVWIQHLPADQVPFLLQRAEMLEDPQRTLEPQLQHQFTMGRWETVVLDVSGDQIEHLLLSCGKRFH